MGTLQHTLHTVAELSRLRQQTQNEERLMGKIEEETRMNDYSVALDEIDDESFFASDRWDTKYR